MLNSNEPIQLIMYLYRYYIVSMTCLNFVFIDNFLNIFKYLSFNLKFIIFTICIYIHYSQNGKMVIINIG